MGGRAAGAKPDRREVILDTALALFNERGTAVVSTNHVAERAGISPGNLYYWFPNKAAIIRALLARWAEESQHPTEWPKPGDELLGAVLVLLRRQVSLAVKYAVFTRELPALTVSDPVFAEEFSSLFDARRSTLESRLQELILAGMVRDPASPLSVRLLVEATWMLNLGTLPITDAESSAGQSTEEDAFLRSASLLLGFLTDEGQQVAARLLSRGEAS